jgi:NifU-like protein
MTQGFSKKLAQKIDAPKSVGFFTEEEAAKKAMRLAIGKAGELHEGRAVMLFWLVDEEDGVIADAKFQVFGPPALVGAAEVACEILLRKNYDQARRLSADLIDRHVRDKSDQPAFPKEASLDLSLILGAIEKAALTCMDIPIADGYVAPPLEQEVSGGERSYPAWETLSAPQKLSLIEEVIANDIRPYIELDEGGIQVLKLIDDRELIITYQGSCTSCYSATGATLNAIQQILRAKVHPELVVTPDLSKSAHGQNE